jgi:hypothetical protein
MQSLCSPERIGCTDLCPCISTSFKVWSMWLQKLSDELARAQV